MPSITRDAHTSEIQGFGTDLTKAFTNAGNAMWLALGDDSNTAAVPTVVQYNGVSFTLVDAAQGGAVAGNVRKVRLYYLAAPALGTHDIVVTMDTTCAFAIAAASYFDARQTGIPDSSSTGFAFNPPPVLSTVSVDAGCWAVAAGMTFDDGDDAVPPTAAIGSIVDQIESHFYWVTLMDSNGSIGPGLTTAQLQWARSTASNDNFGVIATFAPAPDTGIPIAALALTGKVPAMNYTLNMPDEL